MERSFADPEYGSKKHETGRELFLERMEGLMPWDKLPHLLALGLTGIVNMGLGWWQPVFADHRPCTPPGTVLNVGFFADFRPVSYSADPRPGSPEFHQHRGYEADLLDAMEAMDGAGLTFSRRAIGDWPGIWLRAAEPEFDIVGGGITILDSRTRNATGDTVVTFTSGHITFRQSLLVRAADVERFSSYDRLDGAARIGALAGTTGEHRLLALTGLTRPDGRLAKGVHVETPRGLIVADGSDDWLITASRSSPALADRTKLSNPSADKLEIIYGTDEMQLLAMVSDGSLDGIARGEIGNRDASHESGGRLAISVLDPAQELGGFALDRGNTALAACLSRKLDWLTDHRRIGYSQWRADPEVFMKRAMGHPES
ncbi:MAG: transporter substrate-binding domain-containing protein [Cyanobacteria bacterium MAG CAR2_bin_4]|nr:transporter substrate-binding domain-containing protein [Cyanobacteria bacterium MAG CAR2_bin_4]